MMQNFGQMSGASWICLVAAYRNYTFKLDFPYEWNTARLIEYYLRIIDTVGIWMEGKKQRNKTNKS